MDIFKNFKNVVKIREVLIDNNVFQLHYRVTALLLLGCAALVASKQHFGDPIDCITKDDVPNKIMDTYCWIHATFTLPSACNKTVGTEVPHPCVDKFSHDKEERVYHKYYQWVYFVLAFQAACFYAPHWFWKQCEGSKLKILTDKMRDPLFTQNEERVNGAESIVRYMTRNKFRHQRYFYYFILCEVANLINVILQIYMVDEFLGGTFTTYGLDVIEYVQLEQDDRVDPMVRIFPRMTKCTFHRFGSSGDVQKYDALCILPLNIINEKIYIFMWFWFVFLAFVTACWLVYRVLTCSQSNVRFKSLSRQASLTSRTKLFIVLDHLKTGDWFLLSMMCKNMDSQWFRLIIEELHKSLKRDQHQKGRPNGRRGSGNVRDDFVGPHSGKEPIIDQSDTESADEDEPEAAGAGEGQPLKVIVAMGDSQDNAASRQTKGGESNATA